MRIVDIDQLGGGEIIGKDIVDRNGRPLLKSQTTYRTCFKEKLKELNIGFIYIDDELSRGIEPNSLISEEKKKMLMMDFSSEVDKLKSNVTIQMGNINKIVSALIEEISGKDIMYDIMDIRRNDADVYEHSLGVAIIAMILCRRMGLSSDLTREITAGALLHDIGKILISRSILEKTEKLDEKEYKMIKEHPRLGYNIIKDNPSVSAVAKVIILCHHEREDGSGYPLGKGEDLHIGAKIVGCCDVFNALTSARPYRQGMELNEVVLMLRKEKINSEVRDALESVLAFYPIGTTVLLNNGTIGIVEKNYQGNLKRPLVRIVKDGNQILESSYKIDLSQNEKLFIANRLGNIT